MIAIVGCGGHGRSIADVILNNALFYGVPSEDFYFVDENAQDGEFIFEKPVLKSTDFTKENVILALGDNHRREVFYSQYRTLHYTNVISHDAYIGVGAVTDVGNFIAHNAHVGPLCRIGKHNIINTEAVVEHECIIGDFCHIAPNSTISGRTVIGNKVFIGVGATVIDKIQIADNITVGAGATVVNDLTESGIYIGIPARKIRHLGLSKKRGGTQ